MVCTVVVSLIVRNKQCDSIPPSSDWKMNADIHDIYYGFVVVLKNSLYINSPVSRSIVSGSVVGYMNAGFVLVPVLWLSSLSLDGGESHAMPLPSLHNVAVSLLALFRLFITRNKTKR